MSESAIVQIVALVAWLVLAVAAYASLRLEWKTTIRYVLIWGTIFAGTALIMSLAMG